MSSMRDESRAKKPKPLTKKERKEKNGGREQRNSAPRGAHPRGVQRTQLPPRGAGTAARQRLRGVSASRQVTWSGL